MREWFTLRRAERTVLGNGKAAGLALLVVLTVISGIPFASVSPVGDAAGATSVDCSVSNSANSIAVNLQDEEVYVADEASGSGDLYAYDFNCNKLWGPVSLGSYTRGDMAYNPVKDHIYVPDNNNNVLVRSATDGSSVTTLSRGGTYPPVEVDRGTGDVFAGGSSVAKYDSSYTEQWSKSLSYDTPENSLGFSPSTGDVVAGQTGSQQMYRWSNTGSQQWNIGENPYGIDTLGEETVYADSSDNIVRKVDSSGSQVTTGPSSGGYVDVETHESSDTVVALSDNGVEVMNSSLNVLETETSFSTTGWGDIEAHPVDGQVKVFVADDSGFGIVTTGVSYTPTYSVSGTVTDEGGSAIEGATISDGNGNSTTTDGSGAYSLDLANGTYSLTASKSGYFDSTQSVTVDGSAETQDFSLQKGTPPYVDTTEPQGNNYVRDSDRTIQLNTTVDDSEGDDINATLYINRLDQQGWIEVQSWTNVAPGTELQPTVTVGGGENRYKYNLSDSVASQNTTAFTFRVGGSITIFNGSDYTLMDGRTATVDIESRDSNYQDSRTTSDGTLNLTDVPDEDLYANISVSDFRDGSVSIDDVSDPYVVLLYPSSGSGLPNASKTYDQCFSLTDYTGDFPPEGTTLTATTFVDGEWQSVSSERFGSTNEACLTLQDNESYRLIVDNNNGQVRDLGGFTGDSSKSGTTIELIIRDSSDSDDPTPTPIDFEDKPGAYRWWAELNDQDEIVFEWHATNYTAQDFRVKIYEYQNESNEIRNTTYGTVTDVTLTQPLSSTQANKTWVVEWSAVDADDGDDIGGKEIVGQEKRPSSIPLDSDWKHAISLLLLGVIAGAFSKANATAGGVAMAVVAAMLWFIGFLPAAVGGGAIALAFGFTAIMVAVKRRGGDV